MLSYIDGIISTDSFAEASALLENLDRRDVSFGVYRIYTYVI